jgi:hypothetical protein
MLAIVAVIARQGWPAMHGIVGGIQIEDDLRWRGGPRADKQLEQVVIEDLQARRLGGALLEQDFGFAFDVLASGVGIREACQGRTGGQGLLGVGGDVGEDWQEGIVACELGVVAVGTAGEDLVDLLGQEGAFGVVDELGGTGIGQAGREVVEDAQGAFQGTDLQQASVGDDRIDVENDVDRLRGDIRQDKVIQRCRDHDLEPPQNPKLLGKHSLVTARGSDRQPTVRNPG